MVWGMLAAALLAGCVEQTLTITTDPPGALVDLNDGEMGRTPILRHEFTWYSNYGVTIRKEGYETLKTTRWLKAPWYMWVPFDLLAQAAPWRVRDHHDWHFVLQPVTTRPADVGSLLTRADQLKGELQSSQHTRAATLPSTQATTRPATRPSTAP